MRPLNNAQTIKNREYYRENKPKFQQYRHEYYLKNREVEASYAKQKHDAIRKTLFDILGAKCVCKEVNCWHGGRCTVNDIRILHIDHKSGGGLDERKELGYWVMLQRYSENPRLAKKKLQVLCSNRNWIKRVEHKEIRYKRKY